MKYALLVACLLLTVLLQESETEDPKLPIPLDEISERGVMGKLGVPLGTSIAIEAQIIDGNTLRKKSTVSTYLLRVTHVDGQKLERTRDMRFGVFPLSFDFQKMPLASTHSGFNKLLDEINTQPLTKRERIEKKKDYVGTVVKLWCYETGGYVGTPDNLPEGIGGWPDTGFHFSPRLLVLKLVE
ncbi:hypothetical protein [Mariniblastus fucicola]|uniref:Uncharacterized protein n=1 Tax=Mariniblastus fucicola TaxID=980251 RepID=A0A5B9P5X0_9BACT|nr:hypothetical protein [Mariniblastus fucicola]QEG21967.1 hypothetical protein MFFC18_18280 [Mariniblastus fucicola]